MTGQATARADVSAMGAGAAVVLVPGHTSLSIVDGRVPRFTPEQTEAELKKFETRSGPIVALVRTRSEQSWERIRGELNAMAGGQASARVMVMAHHALRAHQALELQSLAAGLAFGTGDELQEKHMRNQAGLAVVATDVLNKAYEAAREEARASQGSATDQLMQRLGVTAQASAVQASGLPTRGRVAAEPPGAEFQPPEPPAPGGSK